MNQHQTSSEEADRGEEISDQGLVWRLMLLLLRHRDGSGQMCRGGGEGGLHIMVRVIFGLVQV